MEITTDNWMRLNFRPLPVMVRGEGSYLWDREGKRYLDFIQGWAVNALGHSPKELRAAINEQLDRVLNVGPAHFNEPALALTMRLAELSGLEKVFLANSGAEANEGAVKLCRKWGQLHKRGAFEVITTVDSFHGRTLAMTCATGKAGWDAAFPPRVEGFKKVPYGNVEAVAAAVNENTVAVMVEPIQGEAGAVVPPDGYLRELRALCDQKELLLVCDEVQTGLCRTGPLFAFQREEIRPDIVTLGKGLGGGLPIAAFLARREVACFQEGDHGSTFGGNALCSAAALAVIAALTSAEARTEREASSRCLVETLQRIASRLGAELRGRGHLFGLVLPAERAVSLRDRAFDRGLLVNAARPNVLRFMPELRVRRAEIAEMSDILLSVC
ncbi:MAG: aminotransferase class III-fold pyridoxal phosphate-dependent enzyme [Myxococcota bacterium]